MKFRRRTNRDFEEELKAHLELEADQRRAEGVPEEEARRLACRDFGSATAAFQGPGILVPSRNAELFRWCLESGLRVVQPMMLMTMGLYNEPAGAYLPSILY